VRKHSKESEGDELNGKNRAQNQWNTGFGEREVNESERGQSIDINATKTEHGIETEHVWLARAGKIVRS
jgi:hypothetical protein